MATDPQIQAVVDRVIEVFGSDADLWRAFLVRAKLNTELEELQSQLRNMQAAEDDQNAAYQTALVAKMDAIAAKQSEIDAL